jgi:hypothetical protein
MAGSQIRPMARSRTCRPRSGRFAIVFALSIFTFTARAWAQDPSPSSGTPARSFAEFVDADSTPEAAAEPMTVAGSCCCPGSCARQHATCETGLFDTIANSIFAKTDPNTWHPLTLSTLFSEGWNEAWVPSPNGSGGAPRQGWINATDGNLYRLSFFTFAQGFNRQPNGDAYLGAYTIFLPLSRRIELITNIPFVLRNSAASGAPIIDPTQPTGLTQSFTTFGDISFTPRVLLHETKDFSLTTELAVLTPTGNQPLAGKTSLTPAVGFWNNFAGGWVIRGGVGIAIPMQGGADTLISQLAIGQTLTNHDVPLFGDFTYYISAVVGTPLSSGGGPNSVSLTPGVRTHLGRDYYLLAGLPTPLTKQRVADLGMIFWFMKAW